MRNMFDDVEVGHILAFDDNDAVPVYVVTEKTADSITVLGSTIRPHTDCTFRREAFNMTGLVPLNWSKRQVPA